VVHLQPSQHMITGLPQSSHRQPDHKGRLQ
jgi:hypothetical protein